MSEVKKYVLDKWTLFKTWYLTVTFVNGLTTYPRYYGVGFAASLIPVLKKLYADRPEEIKEALQVYGEAYYLAEPGTGAAVTAIVVRMEEERANGADISRQSVNTFKTGVMGGLTGFGDTVFSSTLRPLALAIFTPMAIAGNIMGPLGFLIFKTACRYGNGLFWYVTCLKVGKDALGSIMGKGSSLLKKLINLTSVLSMFVMGAMVCKYVNPKFALEFTSGETTASLQTFLDSALPGILPLGSVMLMYWMLNKKKLSVVKVILIFLAISLVGVVLGIF